MARILIITSVLTVLLATGFWYLFPSLRNLQPLSWLIGSRPNVKCLPENETLFTPEALKQFDGTDGNPVYLAFLGVVYDVTRGAKHYGPGGTYSMFAGRDASRAFVTGEFKDEGLQDDVTDLHFQSFSGIREWSSFYEQDYTRIGRVIGVYYDTFGCPTPAVAVIQSKYLQLDQQEQDRRFLDTQYPPCNSEWSQETGITRLWCSNKSGGVDRDWVGFPRKVYLPGSREARCSCVQVAGRAPGIHYHAEEDILDGGPSDDPLIEEYPGCEPNSNECFVTMESTPLGNNNNNNS